MIKVGLIGYGRAGKAVANFLSSNPDVKLLWIFKRTPKRTGEETPAGVRVYSQNKISIGELIEKKPIDFLVDFSSHTNILEYGKIVADKGIKIISAVSNYSDEEQQYLKKLAKKTLVFWSPNITFGVNFLMASSKLLKTIAPTADIQIIEEHFINKKEISGTALKIAKTLDVDRDAISSIRAGGIIGKHEVIFGFPYQTVRIIHEAIARETFGNGALFVMREIVKNKLTKGFYTFEDLLFPYFNFKY